MEAARLASYRRIGDKVLDLREDMMIDDERGDLFLDGAEVSLPLPESFFFSRHFIAATHGKLQSPWAGQSIWVGVPWTRNADMGDRTQEDQDRTWLSVLTRSRGALNEPSDQQVDNRDGYGSSMLIDSLRGTLSLSGVYQVTVIT